LPHRQESGWLEGAMREAEGVVFNIQRYSVHDGPGIRTLVFLKGCPLRCLWCDNPESQLKTPELVYDEGKCIGSKACLDACPVGALSGIETDCGGWRVEIDRAVCSACGICAESCVAHALAMMGERMNLGQVMKEVERDRPFYQRSGGGVTLSGGEPSAQLEFAAALLSECQARGIHTAVETCGCREWNAFSRLLRHTDLVLYDLKHMDSEKHKQFTGVPNELILENARRIAGEGIPMAVRFPIVPGYTDGERNIRATARFVEELRTVGEIHLVPYHRLGEFKYARLGREYDLATLRPPSESDMKRHAKMIESYGLRAQVGG